MYPPVKGGRLVADELLEQQAARKLGHLPKDQLAASSALEKETLEHCTTCDSPTENCKHLHEPMVADIIITDRDAKPRKGSLHRQRWQRIARVSQGTPTHPIQSL